MLLLFQQFYVSQFKQWFESADTEWTNKTSQPRNSILFIKSKQSFV